MTQNKTTISPWKNLRLILSERMRLPLRHPTFLFYFACVVFGGGLGVIVTLIALAIRRDWSETAILRELLPGIYTFTAALAVTSAFDAQLTELKPKSIRVFFFALMLLVLGLVVLAGVLGGAGVGLLWPIVSVALTFVGSTFLWWLVNAVNTNLHDVDVAVNAATGGSIEAPLSGDLEGLRHD